MTAVLNREREIIVAADAGAVAETAANRLTDRIAHTKGTAAICLAGGATPKRLYSLLGSEPYRTALPWGRIHWFIGDERLVPADDPLNNFGMARRSLLDHVPAPPDNLHPVATSVGKAGLAADLYEAELKRFYGAERLEPARPLFDLVLMGLGADGHTASLYPQASALDEKERWVVGVEKPEYEPLVPRVTLTLPALASTREMLFLVTGENKRTILARVLAGEDLPASRAYSNGNLVWLVDRAAAPE